jgi:D-sedoheptulose 7-phosphate isomerase
MVVDPGGDADHRDRYQSVGETFISDTAAVLSSVPISAICTVARVLHGVRLRAGRVYAFGNGGSASTANHLACDLTKTAQRPGERPLRVFSLVGNNSMLTACANDMSYSDAFACQLIMYAEPGDAVVAISASGRSPNIIAALRAARQMNMYSIGLLGCGGGPAANLVDLALVLDTTDYGVIETVHLGIVHALTAALRAPDPGPVATDHSGGTSVSTPA